MAMVTEWTFTEPEELDENDHRKLQDLADFLVDWVMKSTAKE